MPTPTIQLNKGAQKKYLMQTPNILLANQVQEAKTRCQAFEEEYLKSKFEIVDAEEEGEEGFELL